MTGMRIEVCLIFESFARRGRPPALLIQILFRLDFDRDHKAKADPLATCKKRGGTTIDLILSDSLDARKNKIPLLQNSVTDI